MLEFKEIKTEDDLDLLRRFNTECFKPSFPGDDERDLEAYFHRTLRGEFGADIPHVLVATDEGVPVGGCIGVYLAEPNAAVFEYVVVRESHRGGSGLITPITVQAGKLFDDDAAKHGLELAMILDEMEDPFRTPLPTWTKVDRFKRVGMAYHGGYQMLDFPYIKRDLTVPGQTGVHTLMLMGVPCSEQYEKAVPASFVRKFVHAYFNWDNRDETPGPTSYQGVMKSIMDYLPPGDEPVPLFDLGDYVCCDPEKAPLDVEELPSPAGHEWSLRLRGENPAEARASFVPGFGRALTIPPAFDKRAATYVCSRIEKQMIQDGSLALGWYLQCSDPAPLLAHEVGFHPVQEGWLYKPYGRPHRAPDQQQVLAGLREIVAS